MDETSATIKIHSFFLGFSDRKGAPLNNLRVINDVKAKAKYICWCLVDHQVMQSILQNVKEHLMIDEEITSFLFT